MGAIGAGIIVFSNVDELVSPNIEQVSNQISENVVKTTSDVKFTNPLHEYKINSKCDLSYMILDYYTKSGGLSFDSLILPETATKEMDDLAMKIRQKHSDPVTGSLNEENWGPDHRLTSNSPFQIEMFEEIYLPHFMERYNVDPKLEGIVYDWIWGSSMVGDPRSTPESEANANRKIISLSEQDYADDDECGNLHKKYFSETMKELGF